jgi:hypothetical protein
MGAAQHVEVAAAAGEQIGVREEQALGVARSAADAGQQLGVAEAGAVVAQIRVAVEGGAQLAEVPALDDRQLRLADVAAGELGEQRSGVRPASTS